MGPPTNYTKMSDQAFHALWERWAEIRANYANLRAGQALFTALNELYPDLAQQVRGHSDLDPFYNDYNIQNLWEFLHALEQEERDEST